MKLMKINLSTKRLYTMKIKKIEKKTLEHRNVSLIKQLNKNHINSIKSASAKFMLNVAAVTLKLSSS